MEVKKSFAEPSTSGSQEKLAGEMDSSMITTFLETCMKLLHDSKVVKGMQKLIIGALARKTLLTNLA